MKKQIIMILLVFCISLSLLITGCNSDKNIESSVTTDGQTQNDGKVYELTFQTQYMSNHPVIEKVVMPWIEEVKELSNGRLLITHYNPNTLTPVKDTYNAVLSGTIDIGSAPMNWTPGKFPLSEIVEMPFLVNNSLQGSNLLWELYNTMPEYREEYKETKVLWQWASPPSGIHSKDKLVKNMEDLKGLSVICINPRAVEIAEILGGAPLNMIPNDAYMALERNMADGIFHATAPLRTLRLDEIIKYHTNVSLGSSGFYTVINKDVFNSLPEDLQKILEETTGEKLVKATAEVLDANTLNDENWMKEQGHEFYQISNEELARWVEELRPITEKWISEMEEKGYESIREVINKYQN